MRLIVPMGGRGTRLRPFSHTTPKALLPVAGRPAIARSLGAFADALPRPVREVVFVLNPTDRAGDVPGQLEAACGALGVATSFAVQDEPLGTAHAVASAGDKLDGEVLTVWSDTLFRPARRADLDGPTPAGLVAWTTEVEDPRRFGVVVRDGAGRATGLLEKPPDARWTETLIGAYYVRQGGALREVVREMMAQGRTGAGGEYQLTDALDGLVQRGAEVRTEPVAEWLDVGTVPAYLDAVARTLDREGTSPPARPGVTVRPPVFVADDAVVERSTVGPYASIETGAVVVESEVQNAIVFAQAEVRESRLDGGVLGRRAVARGVTGSALLGDDAAVGVEVEARSPLA
ncbi:sugar phosphate nucleotidyltransferase [Rubrivirga sp.]|uniref:sugar phosphate nucleotidyltransferase n=1 Tax=Rubrivirga sp. TaxID=1885344 RepID=UPI003B515B3D